MVCFVRLLLTTWLVHIPFCCFIFSTALITNWHNINFILIPSSSPNTPLGCNYRKVEHICLYFFSLYSLSPRHGYSAWCRAGNLILFVEWINCINYAIQLTLKKYFCDCDINLIRERRGYKFISKDSDSNLIRKFIMIIKSAFRIIFEEQVASQIKEYWSQLLQKGNHMEKSKEWKECLLLRF